ncbi:TetR/AcrR family transcriptional regulator [Anaerosporobacter sp.]
MRVSERGTNLTTRNQYIRVCIAKSLLQLMEEKSFEKITITEVVNNANVSRMTFYKYYKSKQEVLSDYMYEIVNDYMEETKARSDIGNFHDYEHICHCFEFFKQYSPFILTLIHANMHAVIINALNDYMDTYVLPTSKYTRYELYYYAGALCNIYMKWIESGVQETPEEIAIMIVSSGEHKD